MGSSIILGEGIDLDRGIDWAMFLFGRSNLISTCKGFEINFLFGVVEEKIP